MSVQVACLDRWWMDWNSLVLSALRLRAASLSLMVFIERKARSLFQHQPVRCQAAVQADKISPITVCCS